MNLSTTDSEPPKTGSRDHVRLLIAAGACALLGLILFPFEPPILRVCNVTAASSALSLWDWMDRLAPRVFLTISPVLGVLILFFARPSAKTRRAALVLLIGFAVALLVAQGLKHLTSRVRPLGNVDRAGPLWSTLDLKDSKSFPSGHVTGATAIAAALWLAGRRRVRNVVWVIPPLMAYDRLCLAAHWPSDVLGGAAIGLAATAAIAWMAASRPVDELLARLGRGGPPLGRFLLGVFIWLVVTRIWGELPLGRDPVTGVVVEGFETRPHLTRIIFEPILGPPLYAAVEDGGRLKWSVAAWGVLLVLAISWASPRVPNARKKVVAIAFVLMGAWIGLFLTGKNLPDRFVAKDRVGVFVDWHLHGGDPFDGGIRCEGQYWRERARAVGWPILTHHSAVEKDDTIVLHESTVMRFQFGVFGTEWSGPLPASRNENWKLPHVLMLGDPGVLEGADAKGQILDAVREAAGGGALCIVAHFWRSQATIPGCPTFEQLVEAGVSGFEIGNRYRETDPEALGRLRELDRKCREKGLLRFSFSDDHGVPCGSLCVTFLEGDLQLSDSGDRQDGGLAVLARLRSKGGGGITPIPLIFFPGDPNIAPPRWLAPPVMAFEYFRSLRLEQRAVWFLFAALVGLWVFGVPRLRRSPSSPG